MGANSSALGKKSTAKDVVDHYGGSGSLAGKTALITGAAAGIGLETVKALVYGGCRVIMANRAGHDLDKVVASVTSDDDGKSYAVPNAKALIEQRECDLSSLASVMAFASSLLADPSVPSRIDFVVFNAGVMGVPTRKLTVDGFEMHIGVNHFGHAYLWQLLSPRLLQAAPSSSSSSSAPPPGPVRLVVLASEAHRMAAMKTDDLNFEKRSYGHFGAYGQSKLANVLFAKLLADKIDAKLLTPVSAHPGVIITGLWKDMPAFLHLISPLIADKTTAQGAATTMYGLLEPSLMEGPARGAYLKDCAVSASTAESQSVALRQALWTETEAALAAKAPR